MLALVEKTRLRVSKNTEAKKKSQLGQFLTPAKTAQYMAGLFYPSENNICHLLDPGAGIGSLSSAFLERCISGDLSFRKVNVNAFELDETLHQELESTFASYAERHTLSYEIVGGDFIEDAINEIQFGRHGNFTHAIQIGRAHV